MKFPSAKIFYLSLLCACICYGQRKSGIPKIDSLPIEDWRIENPPLSYGKTLALAALIPGGGHIYSKHYVRAGFLFGIEGLLLGQAFFSQPSLFKNQNKQILDFIEKSYDSYRALINNPDSLDAAREMKEALYNAREIQDKKMAQMDLTKSFIAWGLGMHFYGFMDAFEIAKNSRGKKEESLSGETAFWRGLVFPGGGQLYTGRYGKFGMLWMGIGGCVASAVFRQQMVDYYRSRIISAKAESLLEKDNIGENLDYLQTQATLYRKRRNQYYWGMALLYLYAIGDGMVDAILNDFDREDKFALMPGPSPLSFALAFRF